MQAVAAAAQANLLKQQEELEKKAAELERREQELQSRGAPTGNTPLYISSVNTRSLEDPLDLHDIQYPTMQCIFTLHFQCDE